MTTWLLDTGPIVAYLDPSDERHDDVTRVWDQYRGQFVTSSAVLTEAMYLLSPVKGGPTALAELISASATEVFDLTQPVSLGEAAQLMERYRDIPMDFGDATLVLLGEALGVFDVFSIDRRGFSTFRTRDNRPFTYVLDLA